MFLILCAPNNFDGSTHKKCKRSKRGYLKKYLFKESRRHYAVPVQPLPNPAHSNCSEMVQSSPGASSMKTATLALILLQCATHGQLQRAPWGGLWTHSAPNKPQWPRPSSGSLTTQAAQWRWRGVTAIMMTERPSTWSPSLCDAAGEGRRCRGFRLPPV